MDECDENIDEEVKIVKMKINVILAHCTLYCFQYSLSLMLELMFILFNINTWIVIKKMFLNIMIMFIKRKLINIDGRN